MSMEERCSACTTACSRVSAVRCQSCWLYTSVQSVTTRPSNAARPRSHRRLHSRLMMAGMSTGVLYDSIAVATPARAASQKGGSRYCRRKDSGSHAGARS